MATRKAEALSVALALAGVLSLSAAEYTLKAGLTGQVDLTSMESGQANFEAFAEGNPARFGWEEKPGDGVHKVFDFTKYKELRERYRHPLWRDVGGIAKKVGGHGGCEFLMDLRRCHCVDVDIRKMGLGDAVLKNDKDQLSA